MMYNLKCHKMLVMKSRQAATITWQPVGSFKTSTVTWPAEWSVVDSGDWEGGRLRSTTTTTSHQRKQKHKSLDQQTLTASHLSSIFSLDPGIQAFFSLPFPIFFKASIFLFFDIHMTTLHYQQRQFSINIFVSKYQMSSKFIKFKGTHLHCY